MGSLIEELRRREAAARAEADRLRSRMEELAQELARAEEQASRLAIAREEVVRVLEQPASAELPGEPAKEPRPDSPIGLVTVPPWQEGADASVLPQSYQDLLEVVADASRPAEGGADRRRGRAPHGQGEGGGPAVEAEAAGRAGLAGRGARRPVHAPRHAR